MGFLDTTARLEIIDHQPVQQKFTVYVPAAAGSSSFETNVIHHPSAGIECVVDAGSREISGYNVSFATPGQLSRGLYRFTVDNGDGNFYTPATGGLWYHNTGSYTAHPVECEVEHELQVWSPSSDAWLTLLTWRGHIINIEYNDADRTATIECIGIAAKFLDKTFEADDSDYTDTGETVDRY